MNHFLIKTSALIVFINFLPTCSGTVALKAAHLSELIEGEMLARCFKPFHFVQPTANIVFTSRNRKKMPEERFVSVVGALLYAQECRK